MADGQVDRLKVAVLALELYPHATMEQLARALGLQDVTAALMWKRQAEEVLAQGQVVCELCGEYFAASSPFYEQGMYAYCGACCQW